MKPKLIIINGPAGVGKNTIAKLYKKDHSTSLVIDIDEVRRTIPNYREDREQSYKEACNLVYKQAEKHLLLGFNVVIPNIIKNVEVFDNFQRITTESNANLYECVLWTSKEDAIRRAIKRGFKTNSLLQEDDLSGMYDELQEVIKNRESSIKIASVEGKSDDVYKKLNEALLK